MLFFLIRDGRVEQLVEIARAPADPLSLFFADPAEGRAHFSVAQVDPRVLAPALAHKLVGKMGCLDGVLGVDPLEQLEARHERDVRRGFEQQVLVIAREVGILRMQRDVLGGWLPDWALQQLSVLHLRLRNMTEGPIPQVPLDPELAAVAGKEIQIARGARDPNEPSGLNEPERSKGSGVAHG